MIRHIATVFLCLAVAACSGESAQKSAAGDAADYVFTNGRVYTVDANNSWAEAVAVRGNKIVYVGDTAGAAKFVGDATEKIDLAGKMMLPGFVEGHFHTTSQGVVLHGPDLQTDSMEELLAKLKKYADEHPDLEFINGWGVRPNTYGPGEPTAAMLDAIVPDRPVYLWQVDGHSAWVNTKAMEMAGLDKNTPDTVPGVSYFERDAEGNPTGYIVEVPAQMVIFKKFVTIDEGYIREGMARWFPEYAKAGITAEHDFGFAGVDQDLALKILKDFEKDGTLKMRIFGSYYWNDASYTTTGGATVRRGLVFRSDQLNPIAPEDMEKIERLGLKHDFDLRTVEESEARPDEMLTGVEYHLLNVQADVCFPLTGR